MPAERAQSIAQKGGLTRGYLPAGDFTLTAYLRIGDPLQPLTLYIEGDGLAYRSRSQPALDPSPRDPLALRLAALDGSVNVAYLARPCQFPPRDKNPACEENAYWTIKRFSPEIIKAMNTAMNTLVRHMPHPRVHLIGYSGGGAIATLLAAHRTDVISLRTIAGNLDTAAFISYHNVTPFFASPQPQDAAPALRNLPQLHYSGTQDDIIPLSIAQGFMEKMGKTECARLIAVPATHHEGWADFWRSHWQDIPVCRR